MRVLMVLRGDAERITGGDVVQAQQTRQNLRALGVDATLVSAEEVDSITEYDIVHLFHLPAIPPRLATWMRRSNVPIVISPIFWDMTEMWFEVARTSTAKWRRISSALGPRLAKRVYLRWQATKRTSQTTWRRQRSLLERADAILPNSCIEARLLQDYFALGSSFWRRCTNVPNGIDPTLFLEPMSEAALPDVPSNLENIVLEVGRIEAAKNQLGLMQALKDVPVPLVFVGRPSPYEADYVATCREYAAKRGNVYFVDHVRQPDLPSVYRAAVVHALPSWRETPGLVSLEAAVAGCKVVSTSIGSASEYLGELAWYCYPADAQSIRHAVQSALEAPATSALRERVLANYTWQRAAEVTLCAYRKVVESNHAYSGYH